MKRISVIFFIFSLLMTGCKEQSNATAPTVLTPERVLEAYTPVDLTSLFSDRDFETDYNVSQCTAITMQGNTASGKGVTVNGSTVTVTQEGAYLLSGNLTDGMVIVDVPKDAKVQLILNGVQIHSDTSAPIYVKQADKVFITLASGSENSLSCGENYTAIDENDIDAAVFSKEDLTLNGSGQLTVSSPSGHGIVSKDDLRITDGHYTITAAGHGFAGKDALSIADGSFTVTCGKDGFHGENSEDSTLGNVYIGNGSYQITSDGDGISATGTMQLEGGEYTLQCGGGSEYGEEHTDDMFGGGMGGGPGGGMGGRPGGSYNAMAVTTAESDTTVSAKGLKSTGAMTIANGTFQINSADDALHSNNSLTVMGGSFQIATGDDGFHADDALIMGNGTVSITESYEGLEGLTITLAGGDITLKASDDGLNAAGGNDESGFQGMGGKPGGRGGFEQDRFGSSSDSYIVISGGNLHIDADGDGIDSNGDLTFSGGYTVVEGPTNNGNAPLDYGGDGSLSGGTVIISGSSGMAQGLNSTGSQGILAINVGYCDAGTKVTLSDGNGKEILTMTPQKAFGCVIISTGDMVKGENYTIDLPGISESFEAQ